MPQDFFDLVSTKVRTKKPAPIRALTILKRPPVPAVSSCAKCGLGSGKLSMVRPVGNGREKILIIADGPGRRSTRPLHNILQDAYIDLEEDCWLTYAVCCSTKSRGKIDQAYINWCRPRLLNAIKRLRPKKIILLGQEAISALIGHRTEIGGMKKWMGGYIIPDQDIGAWVYPTYNPDYIKYKDDPVLTKIFLNHLRIAVAHKEPFPNISKIMVRTANNPETASALIRLISKRANMIAFDYEATGLKPYSSTQKLYCISISDGRNRAVAFPMFNDPKFKATLKDLLTNPKIGKVAQNLKFEEVWTNHELGYNVYPWVLCTMQASHVKYNQPGTTGLKHQGYVRYGIVGYDDGVKPWIIPPGKSKNNINRIFDAPKKLILQYCGYDAALGFRLAEDQINDPELDLERQHYGYNLMHRGAIALAQTEQNGIRINVNYYKQVRKDLTHEIMDIEEAIQTNPDVVDWLKTHDEFNPASNKQVGKLLYGILGYTPEIETESGEASTGEAALELLRKENPLIGLLLDLRKVSKTRNTYIDGMLREETNGFVHPFNNLHIVVTFRSSADSPNIQNQPIRDKATGKLVRTGIIARKGCRIVGVDFKGIEVCMSGCNTKDPALIIYLKDRTKDMHRDQAMQLFILEQLQVTKDIRQYSKNDTVFPWFYGSTAAASVNSLWPILKTVRIGPGGKTKMIQAPLTAEDILLVWNGTPEQVQSLDPRLRDYIGRANTETHKSIIKMARRGEVPAPFKHFHKMVPTKIDSEEEGITLLQHLKNNGIMRKADFLAHVERVESDFWEKYHVYADWIRKTERDYQKNGYIDLLTGFRCWGPLSSNEVRNYPNQGPAFHCLLYSLYTAQDELNKLGAETKIIGQIHDEMLLDVPESENAMVKKLLREIMTSRILNVWDWINVPLDIGATQTEIEGNWWDKQDTPI